MSTDKGQQPQPRVFKNAYEEAAYLEMISHFTGRTYSIPRKLEKRWRGQCGGYVFKRIKPHVPKSLSAR